MESYLLEHLRLYSPNQVLNFQNNRKRAQAMQLFFGLYSAANKFYFSASHHEQKIKNHWSN